ncbi:MAG: GNAT family N-acetyltransferase, partial [Rhodoglobus sp.]
LRAAMDAETGAVYQDRYDELGPDDRARQGAAFAIDPESIVDTIIVLDDGRPVGHAALRPFEHSLEVKKVFTDLSVRGQGASKLLMAELERLALARGVGSLVLQTGDRQLAAIGLYESIGYLPIPAYGAYTDVGFALCFEKKLAQ